MIDGFTIALLAAEFGQVWAEYVCRESGHSWGQVQTKYLRLWIV